MSRSLTESEILAFLHRVGHLSLVEVEEELMALRAARQEGVVPFVLAILRESRDSLGDLDGGWLQDKAEECGLLERVIVNEPCGENCRCNEYGEFPQDCLRYSAFVNAMLAAAQKEER